MRRAVHRLKETFGRTVMVVAILGVAGLLLGALPVEPLEPGVTSVALTPVNPTVSFDASGAPPPNEMFLTQFQPGHGFVNISGFGTSVDDTAVHSQGTQSLRITTDGMGNESVIKLGDIKPPLNLVGKSIRVVLQADNASRLHAPSHPQICFSSNNFSGGDYWTPGFGYDLQSEASGKWVSATRSQSSGAKTGINLSVVDSMEITVQDDGTGNVTVWVQSISIFDSSFPSGAVSFTFYDNWDDVYTTARPILSTYSFPATVYVPTVDIGRGRTMTLKQLQRLQDTYGWEIATSGPGNIDYLTMNAAQMERDINATQTYMRQNHLNGWRDFAVPQAGINISDMMKAVRKQFRSARISGSLNETLPPGDYYRLKAYSLNSDTDPADVLAYVRNAKAHGDWVILQLHSIISPASGPTQYSPENFQALVDEIYAQDIPVVTIQEMIDSLLSPAGNRFQLFASATYVDGTSADITGQVVFKSANRNVLTVGHNGQAIALSPGLAVVTFDYRGMTAATAVTVARGGTSPTTATDNAAVPASTRTPAPTTAAVAAPTPSPSVRPVAPVPSATTFESAAVPAQDKPPSVFGIVGPLVLIGLCAIGISLLVRKRVN
jgi:peptidoglycan/xylan/chitin deacetylase (PgdA/CDA1 family)